MRQWKSAFPSNTRRRAPIMQMKQINTDCTNMCKQSKKIRVWIFIHHCTYWLYLMLVFSQMATVGINQGFDFINWDKTPEITAEPWSQLSRQLLGNFTLWLHFLVNFAWTFRLDLMTENILTNECSLFKSLLIGDINREASGLPRASV